MKPTHALPLALLMLAAPALAQSTSQLKRELRSLEQAAKKDPEKLFEAGKWAKDNGLEKDAKRLFQKVLKMEPEHAGANEALGNELVEGKWIPAEEAAKLREKALEAEYAGKGYEKVDGVWVEPDHVDDAKQGIFHHDGDVVSRDEKLALMSGKVRHPETGRLIDAADLQKAKDGYFPIAGGKWVDRAEADKFHSDLQRPWVVRTNYATILSTLPLEKIDSLKMYCDQGQERVAPILGGRQPSPARRPVIIIAKTRAEYNEFGQALGDGTDAAGAFLITTEAEFTLAGQGAVRPAICENDKDWGTRYIRHAAAIAYVNAIAEDAGEDLPLWFVHGMGALTSRFQNDADAGWFGKQHVAKGGVENVKAFLNGFTISSELEPKRIAYNLYQAGLLLSYATRGGDQKATDAMLEVTEALSGKGKGSASKAVAKLEKVLSKSEDGIAEHLKALIAKSQ